MKGLFFAALFLAPLAACSDWGDHSSSANTQAAPGNSVTSSEGSSMNPGANPTPAQSPTDVHTSNRPGESGVSNNGSALSGGGGGGSSGGGR